MTNRTTIYAIALALSISVIAGVYAYFDRPPKGEDPVFSRKVLEYTPPSLMNAEVEPVVKYAYQGEPLPEKLIEDEVVALRTGSSYVREIGTEGNSKIYEGRFYTQETFVKEGTDWYYKEFATTTETAWNALNKRNPMLAFLIPEAQAAIATLYTDAGDGVIEYSETDWNSVVTATAGNSSNHTAGTAAVVWQIDSDPFQYMNSRVFLPIITSSLPAVATISAASLNVFCQGFNNNGNDGDGNNYVTVVQTSQATHTALTTADYDQVGSTEGNDSGQRKHIGVAPTNAYFVWTLNSTGRSWIKKSGEASNCSATAGITCFGLRNGFDISNTAPTLGRTDPVFSASETSGTSQDPFLSVTYTVPHAFWMWSDY